MRSALYRTTVVGTILAALAAGMCSMHAAAPQTTTPKKSTKNSSVTHSTTTSNASATKSGITSSKTTGKAGSKSSGKISSRKSTKKVKGQAAPTPERINEIQTALAKSGSYSGVPSGKWDDSTVDATKKFQSEHGLNPSGKLDAPTLQKLGLGSETAGVAAPIPPPNATANRLLSSRAQQDHPENAPDNPEN